MRPLLACFSLSLLLLSAVPAAAAYIPDDNRIAFEVLRKGDKIGEHILTFDRAEDGTLKVNVDVELKVKFLFITAFRYEMQAQGTWRDGQMVAFTSNSNANGNERQVQAELQGDTFICDGMDGVLELQPGLIPTTYWNKSLIDQDQLFNTQDGNVFQVEITEMGEEILSLPGRSVSATHYQVRGELDIDLWYTAEGEWVKLTFPAEDGSVIEYRRI